jgi:hypothetical protein
MSNGPSHTARPAAVERSDRAGYVLKSLFRTSDVKLWVASLAFSRQNCISRMGGSFGISKTRRSLLANRKLDRESINATKFCTKWSVLGSPSAQSTRIFHMRRSR